MSKAKAKPDIPYRGRWFEHIPPRWYVERMPNGIPPLIATHLFPYWSSENAITIRQYAIFAGEGLEWLLASANVDALVFSQMAYGFRDPSEESEGWTGDTVNRLNKAVKDLLAQRREIVAADRDVSGYWQKIEREAGGEKDLPPEIVAISERRPR